MNQAVKRFLGNPTTGRRELSIEELENVTEALETIADEVQADVIKRVA